VTDHSELLDAARELAVEGGAVAMRYYRHSPQAELKRDGTWVTEADHAVESHLRAEIARRFPDHNVLGEEGGLKGAGGGPPTDPAPTWIVDPIDGTTNFMAGIPIWGCLIGLRIDGADRVGAVHAPALGETYEAAFGLGARLNGEPIAVDPVSELQQATVVYASAESFSRYGLKAFFDQITSRSFKSRGFGDFWGHMLIARGSAHVMVEPELSVWDVAALQPIVSEAGGRLTTLSGTPWDSAGSCLTTNGVLHDAVLQLLHQTTPEWKEPGGERLRRGGY
jgi:histidinol-phosphatase